MKYEGKKYVDAIYDGDGTRNPLLEALPEPMQPKDFLKHIRNMPPVPGNSAGLTMAERKRGLAMLPSVFLPMDYMYMIYDTVCQMMQSTYLTRTSLDTVWRINAAFEGTGAGAYYATQAEAGALLGTPGIGKTSTARRCMELVPQVISHRQYLGRPFLCKQVTYLFVECPSDCSIKTLAFNIVKALDFAVGTNHLDYMMNLRSVASSAISTFLKTLCLTYHVGVIIIDEIQNVVETAQRANRVKPLVRFLVELTNDTSTSIYFIGTPLAETVFTAEEHLRRRTRGLRLLPLKPDGTYRCFLDQIWQYQFTPERAELTEKLANKLYDYSGGIPSYIIKIFQEAQNQTLLCGRPKVDAENIQRAVDCLSIKPPEKFEQGVFISDITISDGELPCFTEEPIGSNAPAAVNRLYAKPRGRKAAERDDRDLLAWYKEGMLLPQLRANRMLEELPRC